MSARSYSNQLERDVPVKGCGGQTLAEFQGSLSFRAMRPVGSLFKGVHVPHRSQVFEVVGLVGSLRRGSLNRALMRAAIESAPGNLRITPREIGELPLFNAVQVTSSTLRPRIWMNEPQTGTFEPCAALLPQSIVEPSGGRPPLNAEEHDFSSIQRAQLNGDSKNDARDRCVDDLLATSS